MSTRKIELSVGAVKYADPNEIFTEEELNNIKNKIPELDEKVGVIDNEIKEINSSLETIGNGISINAKSYGLIGDRITDNTEKFQELCNLALTYGQLEIILEDGEYITKQLLIYPNTTFRLSKNAKIVRHKEAYMLFCNLNSGMGVEYTEYNGGYFELTGGYLDGNWEETDIDGEYLGETGAFGHLSRFTIKDTIIVDGANGDHIFDICGCDNVTFDNVEFRGVHGNTSPSECIQIDMMISGAFPSGGSYDGTPTKNVIIQNCKFIPNLDNSKSKMMCPIGSHASNEISTYKNIKIINNYFKDVTGNTINNGIAFQYCYNAEIKNNIFDYSNISLQAPIIDFYVHNSETICPFENIKIEGNVFKLNNCTINDKEAIRVYSNRNRVFRIPNVTVKDNQCSNLNIKSCSCNNVNITNNDCNIIEGGWLINSNVEYNRINQIYMQYTENLTCYKNKILATANNHQLYRSAGTNKNLQILDNTFDGSEFTEVIALKWITSELIKVNDNTFINCTPWDNDWNGMTSTDVEFLRNVSNISKDVKIKRATGMINASYNNNLKYELSASNIIFNSNITDFFNSSATKSIVMSNNSITNGRIVVYSTPSINVNNNVITNPTPSNTAITVNTCKGIVANNVFIQTDDNTSYPNILININDASNVVTTNNDTRNAKVNTSFINNANEGVIIHRNLNKKIFMLKVNSSNQLELVEITST